MAIDPADIAAMREQGDLAEFLLSLAGRTPKRKPGPPEPAPELPRARPGAWPYGTQSPGVPPPIAAAEIDRALAEYRAWNLAGCPPCDTTCHCPACRPNGDA